MPIHRTLELARDFETVPSDGSKNCLIVSTTCDSHYLPLALALVRSIEISSPGTAFNLHVVNPTEQALRQVEQLSKRLVNTDLCLSYETTDLTSLTAEGEKTYFATARFARARELLTTYKVDVLVIDSDCLVVNEIDFDFSNKKHAQICILRRYIASSSEENVHEETAVANGAVYFKYCEECKKFLKGFWSDFTNALVANDAPWFTDQILMYRNIKASTGTKIFNIKRKYIDWDFRDTSVIWTAKGDRKFTDLRYFISTLALSDRRRDQVVAKIIVRLLRQRLKHRPKWLDIVEKFVNHERAIAVQHDDMNGR